AERFIRGLERRLESGGLINNIASVASFFVSRVDTAIDKLLDDKVGSVSDEAERARLKGLKGKAAIANAKIAYERFGRIFSGPRWQKLADSGAMVQRPLWASTSTKNPDYRDVMYIEGLIGPDTVNTMPQATMIAFKDHGNVRPTLTEDLPGTHRLLDELAASGIDLEAVTKQLQVEGVKLFTQSFDELLSCIDSERTAIMMGAQHPGSEALGLYQAAVEKELQALMDAQFERKLWEKDGSAWTDDPTEQAGIKNALGWLNIVETMRENLDSLESFAKEIKSAGFEDAVVLGMGGSSLCPDVIAHTFDSAEGYPRLSILDSTDPEAVADLTERIDPSKTLFIVSSKSGTTAEPNAFYHYFWGKAKEAGVSEPGMHFIAITDPGTALETEANQKGFRRVFAGAPDIGGRYSALSNFGMVPAALMGVDVGLLLNRAETMVHATQACVGPTENPGVRLGAILGVLARAGRDKLTLVVSREIGTFGSWIEQLVAESTGKSGTGILPVDGEKLGPPAVYGNDRVFVYLKVLRPDGIPNRAGVDIEERLRAIEEAGHPVIVLELKDRFDLGGEFFRWEIATATAGAILHIDAFNQPNVQESKDNTNRLLAQFEHGGGLAEPVSDVVKDGISATGAGEPAGDPSDYMTRFLSEHVQPGSYVALMAYCEPTAEHSGLLEEIRLSIRDRYRVATTVGYGPRFLHSTGQFHKGGPDEGVFIQIVAKEQSDLQIEGEPFTFGILFAAQSLGDFQALQKHARPVIRIDIGSDVGSALATLAAGLAAAVV
ncbi:MAG TPA: bifunctional transaldolase/phosoglucose isomerase, partial [Chloroflexota bacterium]|nr:bifunctional transaldolase/phosoglucose isomerase [Chloroflexota bacterium]